MAESARSGILQLIASLRPRRADMMPLVIAAAALNRRVPGCRHLPNEGLQIPDCTLAGSPTRRPPYHPKAPIWIEGSRFRSICNRATVFGAWEDPSGKSLLKGSVGRLPNHVVRFHASITHQAGSWNRNRRAVAKVEWLPRASYSRIGLIVTNLSRPADHVVCFYNQRGTAEQNIRECKNAVKWTRMSYRLFRNNAVRLQLHALAKNLGNFMRTLALPREVKHRSLTTLREKLVKIGAKVVSHGRYITFQLAEMPVPRGRFQKILRLIDDLQPWPAPT